MSINKSRLLKLTLITLVLLNIITLSYAQNISIPKQSHNFYVYDEVGVISQSTKNHIVAINRELYSKTDAQVVVAVVNSLEGRTREEYGIELARKWKIGGKEKNNGVLFLIAPNEREVTIQVGYGLEGAITDGISGEILDTYVMPYFRAEDYDQGVLNGFNAILGYITNEYEVSIQGIVPKTQQPVNSITNAFKIIPIIILLMIDFIFFRGTITMMILSGLGRGGGRGGDSGGSSGGGGSFGGGGAGRNW